MVALLVIIFILVMLSDSRLMMMIKTMPVEFCCEYGYYVYNIVYTRYFDEVAMEY